MKKIVIKLGGSTLQNPATLHELAKAVKQYRLEGYEVVLVHGGGPAINQELTGRGIEWKFINGQRQTTPQMMKVIEEVLAKNVNSLIVNTFRRYEIPTVGLSGAKDGILFCKQQNEELMQVGEVHFVDVTGVHSILASQESTVPVIAPIGFGARNQRFNINADWAATKIAIALQAEKLIFLTDQSGILDQNKKLIRTATPLKVLKLIDAGVISGGMYTKVKAMMTALECGVEKVQVLNAASVSQIFSSNKVGTLLTTQKPYTRREVVHGQAS